MVLAEVGNATQLANSQYSPNASKLLDCAAVGRKQMSNSVSSFDEMA